MTTVHQVVPTLLPGDAVGNHTLTAQRLLRQAGFRSEIYAEACAPELRKQVRDIGEFGQDPADLVVYQYSTSSAFTDLLLERPEPVALNYHNITPAEFFDLWLPEAAAEMRQARRDLDRLAPRCQAAVCDSGYNAEELLALGMTDVQVSPLLIDPEPFTPGPPRRQDGPPTWLFVGRLAPNKCQHDVIGAFAAYRRLYDDRARLVLVGGATAPRYRTSLQRLAAEIGVGDAVELADSVPLRQLVEHFRSADVFVCLSEHEGFCAPIVEAMRMRLPVVAYDAGAVAETVGPAGIVLDAKTPALAAAAVHRVLTDRTLYDALVAAGEERARAYDLAVTGHRFVESITRILHGSPVGDGR